MRLHLPSSATTARRGLACALVVSTLSACAVIGASAPHATSVPTPIPRVVQRDLGPGAEAAPAASTPLSR